MTLVPQCHVKKSFDQCGLAGFLLAVGGKIPCGYNSYERHILITGGIVILNLNWTVLTWQSKVLSLK